MNRFHHKFDLSLFVRLILACILIMSTELKAQNLPVKDSLLSELDSHPEGDTSRYHILVELANSFTRDDPGKALAYGMDALDLAMKLGDSLRVAEACQQLGNSYDIIGLTLRQRHYYARALSIYSESGEESDEIAVLNNLGTVSIDERDFASAERYLRKSLQLQHKTGKLKNATATNNNLGNMFGSQGILDSALVYFEKAMSLVKDFDSPHAESTILGNIGSIKAESGETAEAVAIFHRVRRMKGALNDRYGMAEVIYNLGNSYAKSGRLDSGAYYLKNAILIADSVSAMGLLELAHRDLAGLYDTIGHPAKAFYHLSQAMHISDTLHIEEATAIAQATEMRFKGNEQAREREFEDEKKAVKQAARLNRQRIISWAGIIGSALILLFLFFIYRRYRERRDAAKVLESKVESRTAALLESNAQLQDAVLQKERAQKDLNTLIYRSSHDLKSPLTSIKGLIGIAKSSLGQHEALQYVEMVEGRVEHLDRQLEQLIEQVDMLEGKIIIQNFSLKEIWDEILEMLKASQGYETVSFQLRSELPELRTDMAYLKVVLRNILRNVIDFQNPETDSSCEVFMEDGEDFWEIKVQDNGRGMADGVQKKAFEMFFRGDPDSRGSGMGLYTARKLVELLGGSIKIESQEAEGTTVVLSLPKT